MTDTEARTAARTADHLNALVNLTAAAKHYDWILAEERGGQITVWRVEEMTYCGTWDSIKDVPANIRADLAVWWPPSLVDAMCGVHRRLGGSATR